MSEPTHFLHTCTKLVHFVPTLIFRKLKATMGLLHCAPVAQLDRALVSGTKGRRFESSQARHNIQQVSDGAFGFQGQTVRVLCVF